MGEGLIDFVPAEPGKVICNVDSFLPAVGGAPCNVCAAFAKLGGEATEVYTRTKKAAVPGIHVKAVDTTGAGDGFIGAFLFGLWREGIIKQNLEHVSEETLEHCLAFANRFCSISVTKKGAIRSYPSLEEVEQESK